MKNKKSVFILIMITVLVGAGIFYVLAVPPNAKNVPEALEKALNADGRFEFSCMVETNGESREYFWLKGERSSEKRHISGRVLGSDFDLYYLDENIYRYDESADSWDCHNVADLGEAIALYAELEPAAAFTYESLIDIEYLGRNRSMGRLSYSFSVTPVSTGWIDEYFTNVRYCLFINRWGELMAAEVIADLKGEETTTMRAFVLFEEDKNIIIKTPQ